MVESEDAVGTDQSGSAEAVESTEKANILLVDDRRENLLALEAVLEPLGENLHRALSGEEALRHLLRNEYAVILMDAQMPGMDGFETAATIRMRERNRNIPIIFVTAYSKDRRYMFQGYSVGAVDFIPKPFDAEILRSKVKVFVELYKKNEQLKQQEKLIHEAEMREAERRQKELAEALEREHMRALTIELEKRVAERTAELLSANEQLEAFCYSVSHDLRAPLRAITSTSMMLLEDAGEKLNEEETEQLLRQAAAAKRLGTLIDDLLQLSRLSRREMTVVDVDLTKLAKDEANELLKAPWPGKIAIKVQKGMRAVCDPTLVRMLFQNLLENACKYSPNGGRIEVGACRQENRDVFFVRDHGIGLDMAYSHKIFLPFERLVLESEYEGTGIGLANAHRVVTRHNGRIWVESEPGEGATFYFTLG
jgi:two-component system, sensor histidine kinase and response regulator